MPDDPKPAYPGMRARIGKVSMTRAQGLNSPIQVEVVDEHGCVVIIAQIANTDVARMLLGSMTVPAVLSDFGA